VAVTLEKQLRYQVWSGGRLDIINAVAIKDDIVVEKQTTGGKTTLQEKFGRILDSDTIWHLCGRDIPRRDVRRISPDFDGESGKPTRVMWVDRNNLRGIPELQKLDCQAPNFTIHFQESGGTTIEPLNVSDLADVVPRLPERK
jgi:hypothetical protein